MNMGGDNDDMINNYHKLTSDTTTFHEISYAEFYEKMNSGEDSIFYIGKPTCPVCIEFLPMLHEILRSKNMCIDYLDMDNFFESKSPDKLNCIDFFQTLNIFRLPALISTHGDMTYKRLPIYTMKTPINAWITAINDEFK